MTSTGKKAETKAQEREAWGNQAMYNENIARVMALKCTEWALYAPGAEFNPFTGDRLYEAARAAFSGNEARALHTYAVGYLQHNNMNIDLEAPTAQKLSAWIAADGCPDEDLAESEERLTQLLGLSAKWHPVILADEAVGLVAIVKPKSKTGMTTLREIFIRYYQAKDRVDHPLLPLVRAWYNTRPRPAPPNNRETGRILPAKLAMAPPDDRRAGRLFSMAAHVGIGTGDKIQLVMPGFLHERQAPALPLALYDLGLGATERRGRNPAAPLALRLWVTAILLTSQQDRHGNHPIALEIPLRQLLAELYPDPRKLRPSEYWPRLMKAVEDLDRLEARVPWYDPEKRRGGLRRVVSVGDIPRGPGALDDHVRLVMDLPPGSENGPQVSDNLTLWGVKSGRAYRALLNLAYWWHDPGVTTRPFGKRRDGQGRFWGLSQNPTHYPAMTDEQLVQLVFPTSAKKNSRDLLYDAHRVVKELQQAGELDIIDGKVVPPRALPSPTTEEGR